MEAAEDLAIKSRPLAEIAGWLSIERAALPRHSANTAFTFFSSETARSV